MIVSYDKWRDAIKFLCGQGTNPTLSARDQRTLRTLMVGGRMTYEQAAAALKRMGWQTERPSENDYLVGDTSRRFWEEGVFRHANFFNVFRFRARTSWNTLPSREVIVYDDFPTALEDARSDPRALLYAVTEAGSSFCIPRKEWDHYLEVWKEKVT